MRTRIPALLLAVLCALTAHTEKLKSATFISTGNVQAAFIASADLNGDGYQDLVFAEGQGVGICSMLGKGDGTFAQPVCFSVDYGDEFGPLKFTLADVTGDGKPDILLGATSRSLNVGELAVLPGRGDGTFGEAIFSPVVTLQQDQQAHLYSEMGVGDLNHDGNPDVVIGDAASGGIYSLLGDGTGHFTPVAAQQTGKFIGQIRLADLNGDGSLDFVAQEIKVINPSGTFVGIGKGNGGFQTAMHYTAAPSLLSVSAIDITGDGVPDLVATADDNSVQMFKGNGDGTFAAAVTALPYAGPGPMILGTPDMNGDGVPDLLLASNNGIAVAVTEASGGLVLTPFYVAGPAPYEAVAADFRKGERPDVIASGNTESGSDYIVTAFYGITLLQNHGDGTLEASDGYDLKLPVSDAIAAELNHDGYPDLVVAGSAAFGSFLNKGDGTFGPLIPPVASLGDGFDIQRIFSGDFNGDGNVDALTTGAYEPGKGDGSFSTPVEPAHGLFLCDTEADFNNDGLADCVGGDEGALLINLGTKDGPSSSVPIPTQIDPYYFSHITAADVNGDGNQDIVVAFRDSPVNRIDAFFGKGDGTFSEEKTIIADPVYANNFCIGDLDGDGKTDIVVPYGPPNSGASSYGVEAYFGNGDGTFQQGVEISSLPWIASCAIADFNLDGIPDLVVSDGEFVATLHGLGKRQFSAPVPYSVNVGPGQPHIADVNNDGSPDVIVGSYLAGAENADPQAAAVGGGSAAVVMLNRGGDKGSITTDPNPAVYGQTNLAIVASVAETVPGSGVPSGDVSLALDGVSLGSFPLVNGSASATSERSLNAGQHSVSGHYPGDGNFNPKDFSGTVTVQQATTSVSLSTAPSVIVVGQGLTLTSVVAPEFSGTPTGSVTFSSGSTQIASVSLANASASASYTPSSTGNLSVMASYGGDKNFLPSSSAAVPVTVTDFALSVSPGEMNLTQNSSGTTTAQVNAINGFAGTVNLACSAPAQLTCTVGQQQVGAGSSTTITIKAGANSAATPAKVTWTLAFLLPLAFARRKKALRGFAALVILCGIGLLTIGVSGCGGGGSSSGAPSSQSYTVKITGTLASDASIVRGATLTVGVQQ